MEEKAENLLFKLPCVPSTSGLETKVNELLLKHKEKTLIKSNLSSATYYSRKEINGKIKHSPAGTLFLAELWFKRDKND